MSDCCDRPGYQTVFSDRFARRIARTYRKRGLSRTQRRMVSFLTDRGINNASVLEIGGGVGEIQIELLSRGAREATNLEISRSYEAQAAALLERFGMTDRVTRRFVDIATSPDEVERADVVVLHRVVCCYPDYERLLSAAASRARRLLVFPPTKELDQQDDGWLRQPPAADTRQRLSYLRTPAGIDGCGGTGGWVVSQLPAPRAGLANRGPRALGSSLI